MPNQTSTDAVGLTVARWAAFGAIAIVRGAALGCVAMLVFLLALLAPAARALPSTEGFETGNLKPWSATTGSFWHVQDHPETVSVVSGINSELVTLPDAGALPAAFEGTHVAWFGEASTGTFCGSDWATVPANVGASKNGCSSSAIYSGDLISPSFSLVGTGSAQVSFEAWYEIEAVAANDFDLMSVDYSTDGGTVWTPLGKLNPISNAAGQHDQSYSNNGLEQSPSWRSYLVDLSPAAGQPAVRVRIHFDTVDMLYQGFRGLAVDDIAITAPFNAPTPTITSISPSCVTDSTGQTGVVDGSGFVTGSHLLLDGADSGPAAVLSSQRIEFTPPLGEHTVQVQTPGGMLSNQAVLCAPPPLPPAGPGTALASGGPTGGGGLPPPVFRRTANVKGVRGHVFVRQPGSRRFVELTGPAQIRFGSILDTRRGRVAVTIATKQGRTESGDFYNGEFTLTQDATGLATETLYGGNFAQCRPRRASARAYAARQRRVRYLSGRGRGRFRTRGRYAAATVRGTQWLTEDDCDGTYIKVTQSAVSVRDFPRRRTVTVRAPRSYFARAPVPR